MTQDNLKDEWQGAVVDAKFEGDVNKLTALLRKGIAVDLPMDDGNTALMIAAHSNAEMLDFLIRAGANVNAKNDHGWTPLMFAAATDTSFGASSNAIERVTMLLDASADTLARNREGETAIDIARQHCMSSDVSRQIQQLLNNHIHRNAGPAVK